MFGKQNIELLSHKRWWAVQCAIFKKKFKITIKNKKGNEMFSCVCCPSIYPINVNSHKFSSFCKLQSSHPIQNVVNVVPTLTTEQ